VFKYTINVSYTLVSFQTQREPSVSYHAVDDGTSVIDCVHRQPQSLTSLASRGGLKPSTHDPPAPPTPVVDVGSPVSVVGRVTRWHGSRQINVANIGLSCYFPRCLRSPLKTSSSILGQNGVLLIMMNSLIGEQSSPSINHPMTYWNLSSSPM
jgi:hypothetical protein